MALDLHVVLFEPEILRMRATLPVPVRARAQRCTW